MRLSMLPAPFAAALLAAAPPPQATVVAVTLSDFRFAPELVTLNHGQPVILRLVNDSNRGHNFVARDFFAAAQVEPASQRLVRRGAVEVGKHSAVELRLVAPTAGRFALSCTHFTHALRGMKGSIVVN